MLNQLNLPMDMPYVPAFEEASASEVARNSDLYQIADSKQISGGWAFLGTDKNQVLCIVEVFGDGRTIKHGDSPDLIYLQWSRI